MSANGTQAVRATHQKTTTEATAPLATAGRIVRFVLHTDDEHEPIVRAAVVVSATGTKANLAVYLDGQEDYKHVELGNSQVSAANREGALLTTLRRTGVEYDATGQRENTWHWPPR